jgi:DNA modification methylase
LVIDSGPSITARSQPPAARPKPAKVRRKNVAGQPAADSPKVVPFTANTLYYGDNLSIMRERLDQCVDLIYLDPPFNSDQTYNLMYRTMTGQPVPDQKRAFADAWSMDEEKEELIAHMPQLFRSHGVDNHYVKFWETWVYALRDTQPALLAYLLYMVTRLLEMKSILKPTGSIYLHCDPTASHYFKVMMDGIFGHQNFRSEIIWKRTSAHSSAKRYGPVHDVIFFYSKSDKYTWNKVYQPYDEEYLKERFKRGGDRPWKDADLTGSGTRNGETGQVWRGFDVTAKGRHWAYPPSVLDQMHDEGRLYWPKKHGGWPREKVWLDETQGVPLQDVWTDISALNSQAVERLGYQTQKPIELLTRIIQSSSNPGDVVFDPFCGCGTTIYAAQENNRRWLGCDVAILAVNLITRTLAGDRYRLVENKDFIVDGIPVSLEQAEKLAKKNKTHFQNWSVESIGGFPNDRVSGDRGIDGRLYFETLSGLRSMVLSVKGGAIKPSDIRDLRGVLEREPDCELAGFITLKEPSKAMRQEAAAAGMYTYSGVNYPRIQILSTEEIIEQQRLFVTPTRIAMSKRTSGQKGLPFG